MLTSAFLFLIMQAPAAPHAPAAPPAAPSAPSAAPAPAPVHSSELLQVKYVYFLPMSYSFDQYLANHLTRSGLYQVVTDPAKADAIFTDRLGKTFENKLDELYPAPKPEMQVEHTPKPEEEDPNTSPSDMTVKIPIAPQDRLGGGGSRGRGTYFLVNRATRNVMWSTYERSRTTQADALNETAKDVVERLGSALKNEGKVATGKKGWRPW
ncbi:MAG: hypothetical protein QM757_19045 [Paludibaculum sp.]